MTSLVGREDDVAAVGTLVRRDEVRLLTLIGPGGVGKTRLAMEVASQAGPDAFDIVGFAPLAEIHHPDLVPQAIANALGLPATSDRAVLERIREVIADRQVLLVLDNLEHLPTVGPGLMDVLTSCPLLTILATSRARLNLSGERLYQVLPLLTKSATALFVERAQAIDAGISLTDISRPIIEAICIRVDCLPLAIELAAARLTVLTPGALLERLADPLGLLTGGPHDAPDRQRTMRNVIAWSHDLLPPGAQVLFRRLSVFVGGFNLAAATEVGGDSADILDGLETLIASSLLRSVPAVGGVGRFTMLETIREFALGQLAESGEDQATRRSHALYLAGAMEQEFSLQDGPEVRAAHDRIEAELENCRAAMAWSLQAREAGIGLRIAGAISRTWWYVQPNGDRPWHERLTEGRRWLEQLLGMQENVPLAAQVLALSSASGFAALMDDYVAARDVARDLLERSLEEGNTLGIFWGHYRLGVAAKLSHDFATARDQSLAALAAAPGLPEADSRTSQIHAMIAEAEEGLGAMSAARANYEEAMTLARRSGNPFAICFAGWRLGRLLREAGELARAVEVHAETIAAYLAQRRLAGVAQALSEVASIAHAGGHPDRGMRFLAMARQLPGFVEDVDAVVQGTVPPHDSLSENAFVASWNTGFGLDPDGIFAELANLAAVLKGTPPNVRTPSEGERFGLTRRELEVLRLLADGRSNRGIAEELSLSERTVEHHLLHAYTKLGLESRTAAVAFALRHGLA